MFSQLEGSFRSVTEDAGEWDQGHKSPQKVPRGNTDCACCIIFLVCLSLLGGITVWSVVNGDLSRLQGLPDSAGQVCGVSETVINKPFLYFCLEENSPGISMNVSRQCVDVCPMDALSPVPCGIAYPAKNYGGMICMPDLRADQLDMFGSFQKHPSIKVLMEVSQIPKARVPIACAASLAILLGFGYLVFLRKCSCLVYVGLWIVVVVNFLLSVYFFWVALHDGADGLPATGDTRADWVVCVICLLLCAFFGYTAVYKKKSVDMAMNCIKAASECIFDSPSLLLEPGLALLIRGLILLVMLVGLLVVCTCKTDTISGNNLRFSFDQEHYTIMGFYIFMIIWVMELCNATSQFVVSYAVELWFFSSFNSQSESKNHPGLTFAACEAYNVAVRRHMGTLALGSLLIAVFRVFQILMGIIIGVCEDTGNPVGVVLGKICMCCIECFRKFVAQLNSTAYMDVALNGNNFCTSASHGMSIMMSNATAVYLLKGATFIFELAGLGGIVASGVGLTFIMCKEMSQWSEPASEDYISEPILICAVSGVVCLIIALPFVIVFGHASDTILYCFAIESKRSSSQGFFSAFVGGEDGIGARDVCGMGALAGLFGAAVENVTNVGSGILKEAQKAHPQETMALLESVKSVDENVRLAASNPQVQAAGASLLLGPAPAAIAVAVAGASTVAPAPAARSGWLGR